MGDIKKQRKKFSKPSHPWNQERILAEQELLKEYGLRRKKEIWKAASTLSNFARQAKELITGEDELKKSQLLGRLISLGLLDKNTGAEDILSIKLKDILERRLQTIIFRKNLARSMNQARQFIVHEHIMVGDKKITTPSYLVSVNEENLIRFVSDSGLANPEHSERVPKEPKKKEKKKEAKEKAPEKKKAAVEEKKTKEKPAKKEQTEEKAKPAKEGKKPKAETKKEKKAKKEDKGEKQE
ncbi:30S ribosomal protein S4 [Candidatus Woesearchaeota archaeon]|nr:30S ribosomal protein S4 [Candidatus Woesearchaeota archaeon]